MNDITIITRLCDVCNTQYIIELPKAAAALIEDGMPAKEALPELNDKVAETIDRKYCNYCKVKGLA